MCQTPQDTFADNNDWITTNHFVKVFDGAVNIPPNQQPFTLAIPLDTPFQYTNGNLCVMTVRLHDTTKTSNAIAITTSTPGATRSIYRHADGADFTLSPIGAANDHLNYIPYTRFWFDVHTDPEPEPFYFTAIVPNTAAGYWRLYMRLDPPQVQTGYLLKTSTNLVEWLDIPDFPINLKPELAPGDYYYDFYPPSPDPHRFFRLHIGD
jgi:hypothetical protein